jgi:alpha-tubulin suppressor-like RCC1 family protein
LTGGARDGLVRVRGSERLHRGGRRAAVIAALIATLWLIDSAPAQAHVPYTAFTWGYNLSGQLGVGTEEGPEACFRAEQPCAMTPRGVSGLGGVTALAGGEEHSLALLSEGTVRAWGSNESGQLGDGNSGEAQPSSALPVSVVGLGGVTAIAAGARHSLALVNGGPGGNVKAWGGGESGQLGDGSAGANHWRAAPTEVTEPGGEVLRGATAIAAGEEHSLALINGGPEGTVKAWGSNESGQLGVNTTAGHRNRAFAVKASRGIELRGAVAVAAGEEHSLALLSNGSVMAWGRNDKGQLGNGTMSGPEACQFGACARTAVAVTGLSEVVAIAAAGNSSLALRKDGTVVAWGENTWGQLGNGSTANSAVPAAVSNLKGVVAIAAGAEHSLAVLEGGTVVAWGNNGEGQLGTGESAGPQRCGSPPAEEACSTTPVPVSGLTYTNVKGIAGGSWHSLAFGPPNPAVTAVSPKEGLPPGGTVVTLTGREFNGATAVKFGSANATTFHVESNTSITTVAPQGTGSVDVTVTTPEGTSPTTDADRFSYVNPAVPSPTVTEVSPSEGPAPGGTTVTISGANLAGATAVMFGSARAAHFTVNPAGTSITAISPAGSGAVDVTVTTSGGTSTTGAADRFTYRALTPTVTGVKPNEGPPSGGGYVAISGSNLSRPTAVSFGGYPSGHFTSTSESMIVAEVPVSISVGWGATKAVHVTVTTAGGTSATSSADEFTYNGFL